MIKMSVVYYKSGIPGLNCYMLWKEKAVSNFITCLMDISVVPRMSIAQSYQTIEQDIKISWCSSLSSSFTVVNYHSRK